MSGGGDLAAKEITALIGAAALTWLIMLGLTCLLGDIMMIAWHWAAPHINLLAPAK